MNSNSKNSSELMHFIPVTPTTPRMDSPAVEHNGPMDVIGSIVAAPQLTAQPAPASNTEAAGRLAAEVAHNFNNLLAAIIGNAELLVSATHGENRAHAKFILQAALRGTDLTRHLLVFARQQSPETLPTQDEDDKGDT